MSKGSIQRQRTNRRYQSNDTILPGDFNISLVPLQRPSSLKVRKQLQNKTMPQFEQIKYL